MTDINGSRALITGAASGIGRLLAFELGRAGARLLPVAWFDALMAFFGVSHSMDEFRGR
jgi:NAD(P)-dependent dehydrogenase (short-subunit alcohol dehydrogenase family)